MFVTGKPTRTITWNTAEDLFISDCLFQELKACVDISGSSVNNHLLSIRKTTFFKCSPTYSLVGINSKVISYDFQFLCTASCESESSAEIFNILTPVQMKFSNIDYFSVANTKTPNSPFKFLFSPNSGYYPKFLKNSNFSQCKQTAKKGNRGANGILFSQGNIEISFCNFENNEAKSQIICLCPYNEKGDSILYTNFIKNAITDDENLALVYFHNDSTKFGNFQYVYYRIIYPSNTRLYYNGNADLRSLPTVTSITFFGNEYCHADISYNLITPDITPMNSPYSTPINSPEITPMNSPEITPIDSPYSTPINSLEFTPMNSPYSTQSNSDQSEYTTSDIDVDNSTPNDVSSSSYYSYESSLSDDNDSSNRGTFDETSIESSVSSFNNNADDGDANPNESQNNNSVIGIIIGCVIGAVIIIIVIVIFIIYRYRSLGGSKELSDTSSFELTETTLEMDPGTDLNETVTLYSSSYLNDESDPFNCDFEEAFYIY